MQREIKYKNVFTVYALMVFTLGIYALIWTVKSKRDMNALGAEIPTSWLLIVPIVNVYWAYKYCEGFACHVKKDDNTLLWFCVHMFAGIIMPALVQSKLNNYVEVHKHQSVATPVVSEAGHAQNPAA
jgi:hypothetical protein